MKIVVLQYLDMVEPALHHRIGTGFAVFFEQMFFQTTRIYANPDRTFMVTSRLDDFSNTLFITDVPRIDPQTRGPCLGGLDSAFVVEMDIRNYRHGDFRHDLAQGF